MPGAIGICCRVGAEIIAAAECAERERMRRMRLLDRAGSMPSRDLPAAGVAAGRITRATALRICREILLNAERERMEVCDELE